MSETFANGPDKAAGNSLRQYRSPCLADIAREANLAVSTVSAILGDKENCYASKATRRRVRDIASKLNYVPNTMARALRGERTNTIGLVIPSLSNHFVGMEKVDALELRASETGYRLIMSAHRHDVTKADRYMRDFLGYCVDGIICVPTSDRKEKQIENLIESGFPLVIIDGYKYYSAPEVMVDRQRGGYLQVKHLLEISRRKLAFLIHGTHAPEVKMRIRGYSEALAEAGTSMDDHTTFFEEWNQFDRTVSGSQLAKMLLNSDCEYDGIVTTSDSSAFGIISELIKAGIRVPQDVAVVGFDDLPMAKLFSVPLTTIRQPRDHYVVAFDLLMRIMEEKQEGKGGQSEHPCVQLIPELIVRESTVPGAAS